MKSFCTSRLWRIPALAAALFCWYYALTLSGDMVKSAASVSFRYEVDGIPRSAVNRMLEEEAVPFAAWLQKNGQIIEEREFARSVSVCILEIAGDTELVLPVEELRYGFLPVRGSMDTCAIDTAAAYVLWGGADVTGETLIYDGREYIVTGVFARPENTMLLQSKPEKNTVFPYLELSVSGSAASRRQADEFRALYALPEPDILTDNVETAAILRQLALFPAVLASAMLLYRILRRIAVTSDSFWSKAGFIGAMAAGVAFSAWAVGFSPVFPVEAVPSRWSDFSFWIKLIKGVAGRTRLNNAFGWPAPDLLLQQGQRLLLFCSGGALAGFILTFLADWKLNARHYNSKCCKETEHASKMV